MDNFDKYFNWIKLNMSDAKFYQITNLVRKIYSSLESDDQILLTNNLTRLVNFIYLKFSLEENTFWSQLIQNNSQDLRALLNMLLPYISDDSHDQKKGKLSALHDLYTVKDPNGNFALTNVQYSRCIRKHNPDGVITYTERPFETVYFENHFGLLLMSIETVANKLYVNWMDVLPMRMDEYEETDLYTKTKEKLSKTEHDFWNGYIDTSPGISFGEIYNTIANHFYYQIVDQKWLIFDFAIEGKVISLLSYLEQKIKLDDIWDQKMWSVLSSGSRSKFTSEWTKLKSSSNRIDRVCIFYIYLFFLSNHRNRFQLIEQKLLKKRKDMEIPEEDDKVGIDDDLLFKAHDGINLVPAEEIYVFLFDQLGLYKKSWYYYITKIKKVEHLSEFEVRGKKIYITPKNLYNFAKSLIHYSIKNSDSYVGFPRYWQSLSLDSIETIMGRLLNPPDQSNPWFNIPNYIRMAYGSNLSYDDIGAINDQMEQKIKEHLPDVIFQSLIFHGLLSKFSPQKDITDTKLIDQKTGSNDENKRRTEQKIQIKKHILTPKNIKSYGSHAYYYANSLPYDNLSSIKEEKQSKTYFDALTSDMDWQLTYAMNWVSQLNFYHHYCQCRVILVTGATGVGKSAEVPKLLFYCMYIIDYKINGKVVCTLPRISPTSDSAEFVSKNMGLPVLEWDTTYKKKIPTSNYVVQYKHQQNSHVDPGQPSFLRFVTDGTLMEDVKRSPFLTRTISQEDTFMKKYTAENIYDIIVVDEAHEHNTNMDFILTLMKNILYVNNSLKLVIISATMEDDEPIYRRFYREVNDNRLYPLSLFIESNKLDRANMDRRVDITKPGSTTQFKVEDNWLTKNESDKINVENFAKYGIQKTLEVLSQTQKGHLLLFMTGNKDISESIEAINAQTPANIICFKYFGEMTQEERDFVGKINENLPSYTEPKKLGGPPVRPGTYTRAVIVATNAAEASITVPGLMYVVDTGYVKVNIYDPLSHISELKTMEISWTSAEQRRGRVGRRAPGSVYHLYDKEKIIHNKTAYKIADENIQTTLVDLLKSNSNDFPIIASSNDINNLLILDKLIKGEVKGIGGGFLSDTFKDVGAYTDIINKRYMLIEDIRNSSSLQSIAGPNHFYSYYGHGSVDQPTNFQSSTYLENNHDDYHFQSEEIFRTRCYTGYDSMILADGASRLNFYLIHPDENIIKRNLFTGQMISIKKSPSVSEKYYYYVCSENKLDTTNLNNCINTKKKNYLDFYLPKYGLFMESAESMLMVIYLPENIISFPSVSQENKVRQNILSYYDFLKEKIYIDKSAYIKTNFMTNISQIRSTKVGKVKVLEGINELMWYVYSIAYKIESDVLAMCCLFKMGTQFKSWLVDPTVSGAKKFLTLCSTGQGDIYFIWNLWTHIKADLLKYNVMQNLQIDNQTKSRFLSLKVQYNKNQNNPTIAQLYRSGKLDTPHEFYYWVKIIEPEPFIVPEIISKNISNKFGIKEDIIKEFIETYLTTIFQVEKTNWLYNYEIQNHLSESSESNAITWAKTKLHFSRLFPADSSGWNLILETYLRSHSTNLVRNELKYYLWVQTGYTFDLSSWSKKFSTESTCLDSKTKYLVYHTSMSKATGESNIYYLSPIKLEWLSKLNPIFCYYFINGADEFLKSFEPNYPFLPQIREIISDMKRAFSQKDLIEFLGQLGDETLSKITMKSLQNK
jgi:hypothetical protein